MPSSLLHTYQSLFENDSNLAHERKTFVSFPPLLFLAAGAARPENIAAKREDAEKFFSPSRLLLVTHPAAAAAASFGRRTKEDVFPGRNFGTPPSQHIGDGGGGGGRRLLEELHPGMRARKKKHLHVSLLPFPTLPLPPFPRLLWRKKRICSSPALSPTIRDEKKIQKLFVDISIANMYSKILNAE